MDVTDFLGIVLTVMFFTDSIPWDSSPLFTTWDSMFGTFPGIEHANPRKIDRLLEAEGHPLK